MREPTILATPLVRKQVARHPGAPVRVRRDAAWMWRTHQPWTLNNEGLIDGR